MSYMALYREWRPLVFDDIVEQEHIVKSLKYSVKTGRIAHAYLFCGTRGTGKTTMAQILSRAINCKEPDNGNPCNKCDICKGILSGSLLDVIEIDAASNNSVDNIRDIRDEVVYSPSRAKYKVYIIDEVHMLSAGAFNALLKTLEEPPSHVVFILATTEPHKLPATILSRCQRYDFRRITAAGIAERLRIISTANGIEAEEKALMLIANISDGALRDALSILDQCISLGSNIITYSDVLSITGTANEQLMSAFAASIIKRDISGILILVNQLVMEGKDISQFTASLISYFRNLLVCKLLEGTEDIGNILEISGEPLAIMKLQAAGLDKDDIVYIVKELSEFESNLKWSNHPRVMLEITLIKICTKTGSVTATGAATGIHDVQDTSHATVKSGPEDITAGEQGIPQENVPNLCEPIETRIGKMQGISQENVSSSGGMPENGLCTRESVKEECNTIDTQSNSINLAEIWGETLEELNSIGKTPLCRILRTAEIIELNTNCIGIVLPGNEGVNKKIVSQAANIKHIEKILKDKLGGKDVRVKCITEKDLENEGTLESRVVKSKMQKGRQDNIANNIADDTADDAVNSVINSVANSVANDAESDVMNNTANNIAGNVPGNIPDDSHVKKMQDFAATFNAPFNIYDK